MQPRVPRDMRCDVLVVGGGPVGCHAAARMAGDLDVTIVEEHARIGEPVQCAGLVTPRVVDMVDARSAVLNEISGAYVNFPDGRRVELIGDGVKAVVVDRGEFDRVCMQRAVDKGASVLTQHRWSQGALLDGSVRSIVESPSGALDIESMALLGADGYKSKVARCFGLTPAKEMVRGIEADIAMRAEDQDKVAVFLGNDVAPGFFAWLIPCGGFSRVGLCVSRGRGSPFDHLRGLMAREGWEDEGILRIYSGAIPLGHVDASFSDRVLLAGDAAGMAKPISGGGLYTGMTAGGMAAEVLIERIGLNDLKAAAMKEYERRWKAEFGKELRNSYRVRRAFVRLSDDDLNEAGKLLDRPKVRDVLSHGDIDFPTAVAPKVLRTCPSFLKFSSRLLSALLE